VRRASDVAVILLSGGTTGQPKLIARTHDEYHLNARLCAEALQLSEETVYLGSIPITHNFALAGPGVLGAFSVGGRVVLLPSPSPAAVFAAVEREGVTDMAAVPAVAQRWIDECPAASANLSTLRSLQVGGARMSEARRFPARIASRTGGPRLSWSTLALACVDEVARGTTRFTRRAGAGRRARSPAPPAR
jgi:2,3-dihydroxybenzoate-AMP ligase